MASIKAQGKSRAKEQKTWKLLGPETDPTNYTTLYEEEFHLPWNSLHFDKQTLYIEEKRQEALCYVTVGTLSQLGIVLPIGNVALRVLVLGSK